MQGQRRIVSTRARNGLHLLKVSNCMPDIHSTFLLQRCHFTADDRRASGDGDFYLFRTQYLATISKSQRRIVSQILGGGVLSRFRTAVLRSHFVLLLLDFVSFYLSLSIMGFRCSLAKYENFVGYLNSQPRCCIIAYIQSAL